MNSFWEQFIAQVTALITFFAFPIVLYIWLKTLSRREGELQLWYLPAFGFRLVAKNLPSKKTYTNIHYRTFTRILEPSKQGSSVGTWIDTVLLENSDFFLFPGNDELIFCFKIEGDQPNKLTLVQTDYLGKVATKKVPFSDFQRLVFDFHANMKNLFNFDIQIAKRGEINVEDLEKIWKDVQLKNVERRFELSRVWNVG